MVLRLMRLTKLLGSFLCRCPYFGVLSGEAISQTWYY